jgi:penicillin-binding protein-related factor A (putative recombinase)
MGAKSKKVGNDFQDDFAGSVPEYLLCERYRDAKTKFKMVVNPADYWINSGKFVLQVECKTTEDTSSLPLKNIGMEQVWKMLVSTTKLNTFGGFLINFRSINRTYFVFVSDFVNWYLLEKDRQSLSLEWIRNHGYKVSQQLKITRWKYGVEGLLQWVEENKYAN